MFRVCTFIILLFSINTLWGCSSYRALMRPKSLIEHSQFVQACGADNKKCVPAPNPQKGALDLDTFKFSKDDKKTAYSMSAEGSEARNRLQDILFERSDVSCGCFLDDLYARVAARKTILKTTSLLSSTAAAIVTGEDAQKILAGLGGVAVGTDAIIDSEIMQNQMSTLIINQINTSRSQIKKEIDKKRSNDTNIYSVDAAIYDVGRYHKSCSFTSAITELTKNSSRTFVTRAEIVENISKAEKEKEAIVKKIDEIKSSGNTPKDEKLLSIYYNDLLLIQSRIQNLKFRQDITAD